MLPLTYAPVAYAVVLLCVTAVVLEALPLPQSAEDLASTAPSSMMGGTSSDSGPMSSSTRYYVLAISICGASFALFTAAMVYRLKTRHRDNAAAEATAGATGSSGLGQSTDGSSSGDTRVIALQHMVPKTQVVLSKEQFDMLPRKTATGQASPFLSDHSRATEAKPSSSSPPGLAEPETCSICLCNIKSGDPLVFLVPCHHAFHDECVGQWLMQKSTLCPLCKSDTVKGLDLGTTCTSCDVAGQDSSQAPTVTVADNPSQRQTLHLAEDFEHRLP
ncbi:hypothetical protein GGI21_000205 [Coemansia aciculifera]|nr:hypothetical protein GGI21_000205 [Coemansia aciculifera]